MHLFRKNRRLIAFIAASLLLLSTLAPAISHAMSAGQDKSTLWQEICSAAGNKFILVTDLDIEKPAQDDSKYAFMQHCPYCLTHAGSDVVIHDLQLPVFALNTSYSVPELFYHSPRPLFVWAASNPRAPPIFS